MTRETLLSLRPGAILRMSPHGRGQFPRTRDRAARFVRLVVPKVILPDGQLIMIQVDGRRKPSRWHHSLWEPMPEDNEG